MKRLLCTILAGILLASCTSTGNPKATRARTKAAAGAVLGGIGGAAVAIVQGKKREDVLAAAAAGAVAGAVIGYSIGRAQDRRLASRDDAVREYGYDARRGYLLDLQEIELSPGTIPPGSTAQIRLVYTVLSPKELESIGVAYSTSLYHGDELVLDLGRQASSVTDGGGRMEVTFPFSVPAEAPGGTYELRTAVSLTEGALSETAARSFYIGA